MLQLFYTDVAKVDRGYCICCKCFRDMLQEFSQNVLSVPDICYKRFDLYVAYVSQAIIYQGYRLNTALPNKL